MVIALTWTSYLDAVARLAVVEPTNADYLALAPQMVNYAELRILRDLDFLHTVVSHTGLSLIAGQRTLTLPASLPSGTLFVTVQDLNVITPLGTANPDAGTRNPLLATSKEFLNTVYGGQGTAGLPRYFSMLNQVTALLGPWPDANYAVEMIATIHPASLSATNTTTFISQHLPDLFILASMIWISGYQRNFGRQSDDPQMAVSYESQYQTLLKSALVEEARKKFDSVDHTSQSPAPLAHAQAA